MRLGVVKQLTFRSPFVAPFVLSQRINLPSCHGPSFRLEYSVLWKPLELASFLELIKASTILLFNRGHVYDNF